MGRMQVSMQRLEVRRKAENNPRLRDPNTPGSMLQVKATKAVEDEVKAMRNLMETGGELKLVQIVTLHQ